MDQKQMNTHPDLPAEQTCFLLTFKSEAGERYARLVIDSLRSFGGRLGHCPVWVFLLDPARLSQALPGMEGVHRIPLVIEEEYRLYPFVGKVAACALAEEMAGPNVRSLVWLSLDCLIVNSPLLFDLGPSFDAALRPVHHQNVGSLAKEPMDDFWREVYRTVGVDEMPHTVESFVDSQKLRPYFNTHCFSVNPSKGLLRAWWECFRTMVSNSEFQAGPCRDEPHQVFLHQAILSTLVTKLLDWERVRLLPPEYNYPLNFQEQMPQDRRVHTLNGLICAVYEDDFPWTGIEIHEPLRSWLLERMSTGSQDGK